MLGNEAGTPLRIVEIESSSDDVAISLPASHPHVATLRRSGKSESEFGLAALVEGVDMPVHLAVTSKVPPASRVVVRIGGGQAGATGGRAPVGSNTITAQVSRPDLETIVREYLLAHPEVIREARWTRRGSWPRRSVGWLTLAGYTWRDGSDMTLVGGIGINVRTDDPDRLFNTGLHELMHVQGIGQGPLGRSWLVYDPDDLADTHFPGPLAIRAFDEAGGSLFTNEKVPVGNDPIRSPSHWRPSMMSRELMGPYGGVLSAVTIQALADMGYDVDPGRAEPFEIALPMAGSSRDSLPGGLAAADSRTGTRPLFACCGDGGYADRVA